MSDKIIVSQKWKLIKEDVSKWLRNQKEFLAPLGMIYFAFVIAGINKDGLDLIDFIPTNIVWGGMIVYLLSAVYDLLKKWAGEKKYIIPRKLP